MNSLGGRIGNRKLAQHLARHLQSSSLRNNAAASMSSAGGGAEIQIPFRKERGPTDILAALEKTIKRDPTASHYKYHDDPFLIPTSNVAKRTYALSKESGRKAAMWILKEHANLFNHKIAEPEIPAFMPKPVYERREDVSEELLMKVISQGSVMDALNIYKLMEDETSMECKQALLELLCFHNNQEVLQDDLIEERWYRRAGSQQNQLWQNSTEVEKLFEFLKKQEKPIAAAAYNAMICGLAKYVKVDRAWPLFEECEMNDIPLSLRTYNWIIQLTPLIKDGAPERRSLLLEVLGKIDRAGLRPDISTFNSALKAASKIHVGTVSKDLARSLFTDFKALGVEPSLASYYYALTIFHKERGPRSTLLREIVNELEGKTFTIQDTDDTMFFVTAMGIARNLLQDHVVGNKIHELLLTGDNYDFIGENFKESIYYRHYLVLQLKSLPFEDFMQFYDLMVPNVYVPEPAVMEEVIDALALAEPTMAQEVMTRLFSQMVMFNHLDRQPVMTKTMNMMRTSCAPKPDSPINKQFGDAAWIFWTHTQDHAEMSYATKISWTGRLLADVAILCLRGDEFEKFLRIISFMVRQHASITGVADAEQLNEMFQACLDRGHVTGALEVLAYSVEGGFEESITMGRTIKKTFPLTASQDIQLTSLIGEEALNASEPTENERAAL